MEETGKLRLAQDASEEDHQIACKKAAILGKEDNATKRKLLETVCMVITPTAISTPSLEIMSIWLLNTVTSVSPISLIVKFSGMRYSRKANRD
ncbi:hypothetical protein Trydic_g23834 [Trypoxylus dichotomus]